MVVEVLIVGKPLRKIEHMDNSRLIGVHQASKFEVAGCTEMNGISLWDPGQWV